MSKGSLLINQNTLRGVQESCNPCRIMKATPSSCTSLFVFPKDTSLNRFLSGALCKEKMKAETSEYSPTANALLKWEWVDSTNRCITIAETGYNPPACRNKRISTLIVNNDLSLKSKNLNLLFQGTGLSV